MISGMRLAPSSLRHLVCADIISLNAMARPVFRLRQPSCVIAMEACATAHHWGGVIGDLGHEVRLIPPAYVKPFVKRQKNDMADAEAIAEAASRPTMRFVTVESEEQRIRPVSARFQVF